VIKPKKNTGRTLSALITYTSAAAGEGQVLNSALQGMQYLPKAVLIHCCVLVALLGWLLILRRYRHDKRAACLFLVSTAALGPIGYLGAVLSILVWRLAAHTSAERLDAYYSSLFGAKEDAAQELYKNLTFGREKPGQYVSTTAVIDVLRWGTIEEKYKALAGLAKNFRPEFAASLRFALASNEPTVRIQAATMVAKIEKEFTQRLLQLRDEVQRDPTNSATCLELAHHLDRYAHTGMLDGQREQEVRQQAAALFANFLRANGDSKDARLALGRLLTRLGEHQGAIACLAPLLDDARALSWYCQSLYGLGRFDEIRELAYRHDPRTSIPAYEDRVAGVRQLWSGSVRRAPALASPTPRTS
jgi:hypothetical protein